MNMQLLTYYIGENNKTHKREYTKAINVVKRYFDGFNINKNQIGIWKGKQEKCYTISIIEKDIQIEKVNRIQHILREVLAQESILRTINNIEAGF
jgi:hypothetical protein